LVSESKKAECGLSSAGLLINRHTAPDRMKTKMWLPTRTTCCGLNYMDPVEPLMEYHLLLDGFGKTPNCGSKKGPSWFGRGKSAKHPYNPAFLS